MIDLVKFIVDKIDTAYLNFEHNNLLQCSCMGYNTSDWSYKWLIINIPNFQLFSGTTTIEINKEDLTPKPKMKLGDKISMPEGGEIRYQIYYLDDNDKQDTAENYNMQKIYIQKSEKLKTPNEYIKKWERYQDQYVKKFGKEVGRNVLITQERRWSDWLWLGRHLYLKYSGDCETWKEEIRNKAFEEEEKIIEKYTYDIDFNRCMIDPESENGDEEWNEIRNNVGALRKILWGEWNTDS